MTQADKLRAAERRAEENKAAFLANLATFRARVSAERLKADAVDKLRSVALDTKARTVETVKAHPVAISAGVTLVGAYMLRKPLGRLAARVPVPERLQIGPLARPPVIVPTLPPAPPSPWVAAQRWVASLRVSRLKMALVVIRYFLSKNLRRNKDDREDT